MRWEKERERWDCKTSLSIPSHFARKFHVYWRRMEEEWGRQDGRCFARADQGLRSQMKIEIGKKGKRIDFRYHSSLRFYYFKCPSDKSGQGHDVFLADQGFTANFESNSRDQQRKFALPITFPIYLISSLVNQSLFAITAHHSFTFSISLWEKGDFITWQCSRRQLNFRTTLIVSNCNSENISTYAIRFRYPPKSFSLLAYAMKSVSSFFLWE